MKLKSKNLIKIFSLGLLLSPAAVHSAEFTVFNATELQGALSSAAVNAQDDTIFVKADAGIYLAPGMPFSYSANEPFSLTLIGDGAGVTVIDGNSADSVFLLENSDITNAGNITIQGMTIQNGRNTAIFGSTVTMLLNGTATVDSCEFNNNQKIANSGAGALVISSGFGAQILGNVFQNNSTVTDSGAFNIFAGNNLVFQNNLVQNNEAAGDIGGGNLTSYGTLAVTNSIVINNSAGDDVGGLFLFTLGQTTVTNNTISGNHAGDDIGGLEVQGQDNGQVSTILDLYNNIIFGNLADDDIQDLYLNDIIGMGTEGFVANVFNNDYSLLISECAMTGGCTPGITEGNNISANPLFIDLLAGNVHLGVGSPAIDAGDPDAPLMPATDFDGVARPFGTNPDMGALEAVSALDANPKNIDFGEIQVGDASDTVIVTVENVGVADLNITSMVLDDADNFGLDVNAGENPCGSETPTIGGGAGCTIGLFFAPDEEGQIQSQLTISSDAPTNPIAFINLRGVGINPINPDINGGACALGASSNPASAMGLLMMALTAGALLVSLRRRSH